MSVAYVITGPLPVNGKNAGETIARDELTDPDFLLAIGWIAPTKKAPKGGAGLVESPEESEVDSLSTKQETE